MKLQFWGAARTVTGSMHLLEAGGRRLLLDCGLYQGKREEAFQRNSRLPFDAASIDAVVLSHAHIDHSGNLPSLVKAGFDGPIYATSATRDLCLYMLLDSAHIQESDVAYVNRKRSRHGERPFRPLYDRDDALEALGRFVTVEMGRRFGPIPGVEAQFINAGHILGAATVSLDIQEAGRRCRLVFSGDIGRRGQPILRDPEIAPGAEVLIMESTYGDREHLASGEAKQALARVIRETCFERGGKVLIPAFAVGRTQELVYRLNQLRESGDLPRVEVFVDSPLAINATEVLRLHPEAYDAEMRATLQQDDDRDPLGFQGLHYLRDVERSKELNTRLEPAVIISASGMCEGGRILHHLANHVSDPRNTLLFVGFQAESTLGRYLLDGRSPVRIFGEAHPVRAKIERIEGYSAHAGRSELLDWAAQTRAQGDLGRVFLVHGEPPAMDALAEGLQARGLPGVTIPERGQVFDL